MLSKQAYYILGNEYADYTEAAMGLDPVISEFLPSFPPKEQEQLERELLLLLMEGYALPLRKSEKEQILEKFVDDLLGRLSNHEYQAASDTLKQARGYIRKRHQERDPGQFPPRPTEPAERAPGYSSETIDPEAPDEPLTERFKGKDSPSADEAAAIQQVKRKTLPLTERFRDVQQTMPSALPTAPSTLPGKEPGEAATDTETAAWFQEQEQARERQRIQRLPRTPPSLRSEPEADDLEPEIPFDPETMGQRLSSSADTTKDSSMYKQGKYFEHYSEYDETGGVWELDSSSQQIVRKQSGPSSRDAIRQAIAEGGVWDYAVGDTAFLDAEAGFVPITVQERLPNRSYKVASQHATYTVHDADLFDVAPIEETWD